MKKLILCVFSFFLLVSCATAPLEISNNDAKLRMIGGKEAMLDDIIYPEFALNQGIEGVVTILAYIDTSGSVCECNIVEGNEFLNEAAVNALKKQRFYPYTIEGKKCPVRVAIPVSFIISKDINVKEYEKKRLTTFAEYYVNEPVLTLLDFPAERSRGNGHEFYSEGRTWWPNPDGPNAAYMIREGYTNPDAFRKHAALLERVGEIIPGLTAAYLVTGKKLYAEKAVEHVKAWFVDPQTRMEPNLNHAQAIPNRTTGRAVGIIEGLPLVEIIQSYQYLGDFLNENDKNDINKWLRDYEKFLEFGDYCEQLMRRKDNYSTAWLLQVSMIAKHLDDDEMMGKAENYFQQHTMSFALNDHSLYFDENSNRKLEYNIFSMADMMAIECEILSDRGSNAWENNYYNGTKAVDLINYLYSGILNNELKTMGNYDGRFLSLLFAGKAYDNSHYLELWRDLQIGKEGAGDFPVRQPVLWVK